MTDSNTNQQKVAAESQKQQQQQPSHQQQQLQREEGQSALMQQQPHQSSPTTKIDWTNFIEDEEEEAEDGQDNNMFRVTRVLRRINVRNYQTTLDALESLITQATKIPRQDQKQVMNLEAMHDYVERLSLDLNKLSVIHVAGTKGKGSTCAMCESILRESGYKTGLYTSPHLIDVRERIRINGQPISQDKFINHFWDCWNMLQKTKNDPFPSMATYFRFLTLMGFKAFIDEGVDVAIVEVGLGGRIDATNLIPHPVVTGITSLGFDHVNILGNTLSRIAWEKAGIMKPSIPTVTSPQKEEAMAILKKRAYDLGTDLYVAPPLEEFERLASIPKFEIGISGEHQRINASVALSLCKVWMDQHEQVKRNLQEQPRRPLELYKPPTYDQVFGATTDKPDIPENLPLKTFPAYAPPASFLEGLAKCYWPGRGHIVQSPRRKNVTFYLDGAHTDDSLAYAITWFTDVLKSEDKNKSPTATTTHRQKRILIFNCTEDRNPRKLLVPLVQSNAFDHVIFCPPESNKITLNKAAAAAAAAAAPSSTTTTTSAPKPLEWQNKMVAIWRELEEQLGNPSGNNNNNNNDGDAATTTWRTTTVEACPSVDTVLDWISLMNTHEDSNDVRVLVTGSFYLVGDMLRKLDPHQYNPNNDVVVVDEGRMKNEQRST